MATLNEFDRLNAAAQDSPSPEIPTFLALAQYHLGQVDQSRAALSRLRDMMKKPNRADDAGAQAFLREAEVIEMDLAFPADPFAP